MTAHRRSHTKRRRRYRVAVTTRFGGTHQVYVQPGPGRRFSYRRGKKGRGLMNALEVEAAKAWARRRLARRVRVAGPDDWLFLELAAGARWPTNRRLLKGLEATGRQTRQVVRIISGLRTAREAWDLRQRWVRYRQGRGPRANLAAPCCSRYGHAEVLHSWAQCGKDPWSNHADGNAADCGVVNGRTGGYTSLDAAPAGQVARRHGIGFPVDGEPWHAEAV